MTAVAVTSAPQNRILPTYRRGETIEVSVTFSAPVTVSGTPTIGLEVGMETRQAEYLTSTVPNVLVFGYMVAADDTDDNGIAVPANGIRLSGGSIVDAQGGAAGLGHAALAADAAHKVDGSGTPALTGGVCDRTPEVREVLKGHASAINTSATACSQVGEKGDVGVLVGLDELAGALDLSGQGIAVLKHDDFEGLTGVPGLDLSGNALSALPDRVFEPLTGMATLDLRNNPGSASFVPTADAGADPVLRAGESATLGGPGTGGGPWGTNVEYAWVEVDAEGNPVAETERTEGLSATDVARPNFTAPALAAERVVRYRFTVTGKGAATTGAVNRHRASDTVTVTVRAAPAVTGVALTSVPRADATYREGERIEVSVTFSAPVTVTGTPTIGLEVGTVTREAAYLTRTGPTVLVFGYTVTADDTDDDGIAVPADGILLAGGTIGDVNGAALLGHDAVAADAAQRVDGSLPTGGVCERTPQVRDALVAKAKANDPLVTNCSQVGDDDGIDELAGITDVRLNNQGIAALKPGDFAGLSGVTTLLLSGNALSALPAGVFDGLGAVTVLTLSNNALGAGSLEDGVFEPLTGLSTLNLLFNPGLASFVPKADAGADLVLRAGESATLGGAGTGGGPWGTNVTHTWVEVDADDNPVAEAERTEGLSATDVARPGFTAPALAAERVLRYRLAVQGRGHGGTDAYTATDTVTVTVRAAPAVTGVGLTSVPQADGEYRRDETIEVSVTFSAPVTVTGTPTIGLEVGTATRPAAYVTKSAPHVLVFGYTVIEDEMDADGVAVPADGIALAGGTIADAHGVAALLGHDAVAADTAHMVDGSTAGATGGVCDRTPQVRDALVAAAKANRAAATDCSLVTTGVTGDLDGITSARCSSRAGASRR